MAKKYGASERARDALSSIQHLLSMEELYELVLILKTRFIKMNPQGALTVYTHAGGKFDHTPRTLSGCSSHYLDHQILIQTYGTFVENQLSDADKKHVKKWTNELYQACQRIIRP